MGLQGYVGSSLDQTRIRRQEKEREEERKRIEELKKETEAKVISAGLRRFGTGTAEVLDTVFKNETVGLVTREEFLRKRNNLEERLEEQNLKGKLSLDKESVVKPKEQKKKQKRKEKVKATLSFNEDEEEDLEEVEEEIVAEKLTKKQKLSKYGKCPNVETEFLPDIDRDREQAELREELKKEWKAQQEIVKAEEMDVVYSYWDGTGHRRITTVKKGFTVGDFLKQAREQLSKDFHELKVTSIDNLLYIKEDVIIPHNYTFYDLIIRKARGKSGPLYQFNAHEDIRIVNDAGIEKEDSHAGKVVERHWYDRNKHIFPASRWEVYDPDRTYETYTIHD